jgi:hypothetical protein
MSTTLVALSPDLSRLVSEGYDVEVRDGNLLVHHVPYLNADGDIAFGVLVSELTTNGEHTVTPGSHQVRVVGGIPHDHQGKKLTILLNEAAFDYGNGLVASCELSGKLRNEAPANYFDKMSN